jgi:hypothetical protein
MKASLLLLFLILFFDSQAQISDIDGNSYDTYLIDLPLKGRVILSYLIKSVLI